MSCKTCGRPLSDLDLHRKADALEKQVDGAFASMGGTVEEVMHAIRSSPFWPAHASEEYLRELAESVVRRERLSR